MCATPNKRPDRPTPEMKREAALIVAKSLINGGGFGKDDTPEDLADDIVKASGRCFGHDGYELGKALESHSGWSVDSSIVEELETFYYECDTLVHAAEKQWGAENPMQPPLPIGAVIKTSGGVGVIDHIYEHIPACYAVKVPRLSNGFELIRFEKAVAA